MPSIELIIEIGCLASILLYFLVAAYCNKLNRTPSDYFYADFHISGLHYGNTYMGANITFTSIFIYLCYQSTISGLTVLWASIFWFIGVLLFYFLADNLLDSFKKGQTIHQYISETYNSKKLLIITSSVTIFAFIGTIALEFIGFSLFLRYFGVSEANTYTIGAILIVLMSLYCTIGGYWATIKTDIFQVVFTVLGACYLLNLLVVLPLPFGIETSKFEIHRNVFSSITANELFKDPALIVGYFILFIPFQFSVMDMWERCVATGGEIKRIKIYTLIGGAFLSIMFAIPVFIGILSEKMGYSNGIPEEILFVAVKQLSNPYIISLVGVMFLASVFSTADTLLLAAANSFICDLYTRESGKPVTAYQLNQTKNISIRKCKIITTLLCFLTILFFLSSMLLDLSEIIIAVFSAQSILGTIILLGFYLKEKAKRMALGAELACIVGLLAPVPIVLLGKYILNSPDLVNVAPLVSIFIAVLVLFVSPKRKTI